MLNVTPDSFSDGGRFLSEDDAVAHGVRLIAEGAEVIDVGGESSRPAGVAYGAGAVRVDAAEEIRRVVPVVRRLVHEHGARVSVDTVKPEVAQAALEAGAVVVNDVSCGAVDGLARVAAAHGAELVVMHTRGRGEIDERNTAYRDLVGDVIAELLAAVARAEHAGVPRARIWIDPGIGFAKTWRQSLRLIARTDALVATGYRVLVGPSRKAFIAEVDVAAGRARPEAAHGARLGGTIAAATAAMAGGASALRVHDVAPVAQALRMARELARAGGLAP